MNEEFYRRMIAAVLLAVFVALAYAVVNPFLVPVAWAGVLAHVTWPAYGRLRRQMPGHLTLSASLMTLILGAIFLLPLVWLIAVVRMELPVVQRLIAEQIARGLPPLPAVIRDLPYLGQWINEYWQDIGGDPDSIRDKVDVMLRNSTAEIAALLGGVGRNSTKFAITLLTVFFLYRDGERVYEQFRHVLRRFLGAGVDEYIVAAGNITKAVVYGEGLAALAQGLLAGIGYWAVGLSTPLLLGAVTVLVALIPFGTPFVWVSLGVWLVISGDTWSGIGLLLWGALVVSWIDNLVRPLVISRATHVPFLIVLFGVLGGLAAFGFIGVFLGPVILAVLMAIWREWLADAPARAK
jgi:predicted PurR-regulated permease PerM